MTERATQIEALLARERHEHLERRLLQKQAVSIALAILFITGGAIAGIFGLPLLAFCLAVMAIIGLVRFFDANGHLHEVRRRSCNSLAPDFSVLKRKDHETSSHEGQSMAHGS